MISITSSSRQFLRTGLVLVLLLGLASYLASSSNLHLFPAPSTAIAVGPSTLRGAWVQSKSLTSQAKIAEVLRRAETGHLNAVFVNVFDDGRTAYPSALTDQISKVEPGFDPLAYLVTEAHRRNIQIHAWYAVGRIGNAKGSPVLARHPEWGLEGPDGKTIAWLNFTHPDARKFMSDLILEAVERYGVDGVHFDYTRYPGSEWGFDPYSVEAFTKQYGFDLNQLRYTDLPAYGPFEANPLSGPRSAQVLAKFSNGLPAVTLNTFGKGEVIVLNWKANQRMVAVGTEILQRSLRRSLGPNGQVYLLHSDTNIAEYGDGDFLTSTEWLQDLGWNPIQVADKDTQDLNTDSVLVVPNVYVITQETATYMANFVDRGGGIIFIDGPTRSIGLSDIQAITGMTARSKYFKGPMLMVTTGEHPLIPPSRQSMDLSTYQLRDAQWQEFRTQGVSALIKDVYQRVKAQNPETIVSVTITADQDQAAQENFQDWRAWLEAGYVDALIPRAYVKDSTLLTMKLDKWLPEQQRFHRLTFGVIDFVENGKSQIPKPPSQLLAEIKMVEESGSNGIMIFDLDRISEEQLQALSIKFSSPGASTHP